jgi:hypothetical protein
MCDNPSVHNENTEPGTTSSTLRVDFESDLGHRISRVSHVGLPDSFFPSLIVIQKARNDQA